VAWFGGADALVVNPFFVSSSEYITAYDPSTQAGSQEDVKGFGAEVGWRLYWPAAKLEMTSDRSLTGFFGVSGFYGYYTNAATHFSGAPPSTTHFSCFGPALDLGASARDGHFIVEIGGGLQVNVSQNNDLRTPGTDGPVPTFPSGHEMLLATGPRPRVLLSLGFVL
jgi:hypothetical protein